LKTEEILRKKPYIAEFQLGSSRKKNTIAQAIYGRRVETSTPYLQTYMVSLSM
jgi:hypothetical protein